MKITKEWLKKQYACEDGIKWFLKQRAFKLEIVIMKLLKEDHFDWANWIVVRFMTHKQQVIYAAFAAKQVLSLFEKKYPNDKRPREAIEAALRFAECPISENRDAAYAAANAVVNVAVNVAANAANVAYAAANVAYAAANVAANAAANANAYDAANIATNAASPATNIAMKRKIVVYGLKLLAKGLKQWELI